MRGLSPSQGVFRFEVIDILLNGGVTLRENVW